MPVTGILLSKGSAALQAYLAEISGALGGSTASGRPAEDAMQEVVEAILRSLDMEYTPRWRGTLAGSIDTEVYTAEGVTTGVVFSDLIYAPAQERGTDPYWPNVDNLVDWAEEHWGIAEPRTSPEFVLARHIAEEGIAPKGYFEQALEANLELVGRLFNEFVANLVETPISQLADDQIKYP